MPFPVNCDDQDLTTVSILPRPPEQPTDICFLALRAQAFIVIQKLFIDNCARLSDYQYVQGIDTELMRVVESFPWYARIKHDARGTPALPTDIEHISWSHHVLHSCICVQRIRMYRPFLHPPMGEAARICAENAEDILTVYFLMRRAQPFPRKSPKLAVHIYQLYSAAVAMAAFLLVESTFPHHKLRSLIETTISDLDYQDDAGPHIVAVDGGKILRKMLQLYDRREGRDSRESESLAPAIASVFGGEETTVSYLRHQTRNRQDVLRSGGQLSDAPRTLSGRQPRTSQSVDQSKPTVPTRSVPEESPTYSAMTSDDMAYSGFASAHAAESLVQLDGTVSTQFANVSPFNQWSDEDLAFLSEISKWDEVASQLLMPS